MKIPVRIIPNASKTELQGRTVDGTLKVRIQSPPVDVAANKNLIKFMAGLTGVSKSKVKIIQGEKSRNKVLEIAADEKKLLKFLDTIT